METNCGGPGGPLAQSGVKQQPLQHSPHLFIEEFREAIDALLSEGRSTFSGRLGGIDNEHSLEQGSLQEVVGNLGLHPRIIGARLATGYPAEEVVPNFSLVSVEVRFDDTSCYNIALKIACNTGFFFLTGLDANMDKAVILLEAFAQSLLLSSSSRVEIVIPPRSEIQVYSMASARNSEQSGGFGFNLEELEARLCSDPRQPLVRRHEKKKSLIVRLAGQPGSVQVSGNGTMQLLGVSSREPLLHLLRDVCCRTDCPFPAVIPFLGKRRRRVAKSAESSSSSNKTNASKRKKSVEGEEDQEHESRSSSSFAAAPPHLAARQKKPRAEKKQGKGAIAREEERVSPSSGIMPLFPSSASSSSPTTTISSHSTATTHDDISPASCPSSSSSSCSPTDAPWTPLDEELALLDLELQLSCMANIQSSSSCGSDQFAPSEELVSQFDSMLASPLGSAIVDELCSLF